MRNWLMRRANLRRIATRIDRAANSLEAGGADVSALRAQVAALRREADAGQPRRIRRLWTRGCRGRRADEWTST